MEWYYKISRNIFRRGLDDNYWSIGKDQPGSSGLLFSYDGISRAYVDPSTYVHALDFTGQHRNKINENIDDLKPGMILVATDEIKNYSVEDKPTINETLPVCILSTFKKDKRVFGVYSNNQDIDQQSSGAFVSILKPLDESVSRYYVNSVGEGAILVCNEGGNIENGDYIMSSSIKGIGMKQDDDILHNYTVAKITRTENFTTDYQEIVHTNGQTYRYKLVGCTYHCG